MRNQSGFTPINLLILTAVFVLLGVVGWRVWDSRQTPNKDTTTTAQNTQSQQTPTPNPNQGYIVIKEWNVRFKPVEGLEGVEYIKDSTGNTVEFSTTALMEYGNECSPNGRPIGVLRRARIGEENSDPIITSADMRIGDHYYHYTTPQATCTDDEDGRKLQTQTIGLLKQSIELLEAAK